MDILIALNLKSCRKKYVYYRFWLWENQPALYVVIMSIYIEITKELQEGTTMYSLSTSCIIYHTWKVMYTINDR